MDDFSGKTRKELLQEFVEVSEKYTYMTIVSKNLMNNMIVKQ